MIACFDFVPKMCPHCGADLTIDTPYNRGDYLAGASCGCPKCGLLVAFVPKKMLVKAAQQAGSDLPQYAEHFE